MTPVVTEISEDAQLVIAARNGDRAAFGQIYRRYRRMVHGILLARVPPDEVDDLVQDVFLLALRRLGALRTARRPLADGSRRLRATARAITTVNQRTTRS